jgi:uncharacterized protein
MKTNKRVRALRILKSFEHRAHNIPFLLHGGAPRFAERFIGDFEIRRIALHFPNLPSSWNGFTITHLTDLHLGSMFTPHGHLPPLIDACLNLKSDIICITGDWIDRKNHYLIEALPILKRLKAPFGVIGTLGNHDFRESRWQIIQHLRGWLKDDLLINEGAIRKNGSDPLVFLGMDYAARDKKFLRHFHALQSRRPFPDAFTIGLSHHPHGFDFLSTANVPLTLSGHTHGGQIAFTRAPGRFIGPAMIHRFRYIRGLYERNGAKLFVNLGIGHSIPYRMNSPAEILQFTLCRTA